MAAAFAILPEQARRRKKEGMIVVSLNMSWKTLSASAYRLITTLLSRKKPHRDSRPSIQRLGSGRAC